MQLDSCKEESHIQQKRLEKEENDVMKQSNDVKTREEKLLEEFFKLKYEISSLKSHNFDAAKIVKAHKKNVYNLEKKNEQLMEQTVWANMRSQVSRWKKQVSYMTFTVNPQQHGEWV